MLGRQVLRSGTSIGADDREAQFSRSKSEFIATIGDGLEELNKSAKSPLHSSSFEDTALYQE